MFNIFNSKFTFLTQNLMGYITDNIISDRQNLILVKITLQHTLCYNYLIKFKVPKKKRNDQEYKILFLNIKNI